jgi:EAL domain-containing protein (putative c-di-GMP-specific phosphodiesterase class I)
VRIAVDHFGTGYATISFLQRLPIDMLKIDRSFVAACGDERGRGLLEALVHLGQTLSVETVGEGAEEPGQLEVLCDLGCDMVQGFLLSRPISANETALLIRQPAEDEASVSPFVGRWLQRHVVNETARALS